MAETEIGFLLLKGLSYQEIADVRQTSERTAREQSRSLYRKVGLSGRNELAAFFLEVLLQTFKPRIRFATTSDFLHPDNAKPVFAWGPIRPRFLSWIGCADPSRTELEANPNSSFL